MADEVWIKYTELQTVSTQLSNIVTELDGVGSKQDALEEAIGAPWYLDRLRSRSHDFEGRWDDKRKYLLESLKEVQAHVQGIVDGFQDWDQDTASHMEVDAGGVNQTPR